MNHVATLEGAPMSRDQTGNLKPPLSVSQLVALLKSDVEEKHRFVRVAGELSSFKQWRSGHCYFDIKDEEATLPAVMFKPHFSRLPFDVKDGMQILFSGRISIYSANARLQMIVESMEPLGQGALALAFLQLKERLENEGLFDNAHKKPIKALNQCVGLITSSHGAVLRDMVRILQSRMPKVDILFMSVRVQGAGAALEIKNALQFLDNLGVCDVIIVGRGGGSLEDLWAFNEEMVARAIFLAKTPIISAVGHETDTTISDFVADLRAATPTHAATLVVPELTEVLIELRHMTKRLRGYQEALVQKARLTLAEKKRRLKDPRVVLFRHWQRLDEMHKKLDVIRQKFLREQNLCLENLLKTLQFYSPFRQLRLKREVLIKAKERLHEKNPRLKIVAAKSTLVMHKRSLNECIRGKLAESREGHGQIGAKLHALSPLAVLSRGFSIVEDENCSVLGKRGQFSRGQLIRIRLLDGVVQASVVNTTKL